MRYFECTVLEKTNMSLISDEFRNALAKGQGRAVLHVRESSADAVRDALLDALLSYQGRERRFGGL